LSANVVIASTGSEISSPGSFSAVDLHRDALSPLKASSAGKSEAVVRSSLSLVEERVSPWSHSGLKRFFDIVCVLLALPLLIPIFIVIALAVRFTSKGPVLFLQKRTGLHRRNFTILKFRTMEHLENGARNKVTTAGNQRFTPVGPYLRRWKLDELPQLLNVLIGDMTLVGPRPKLPEHQLGELKCRPGITGAATIAFAREEQILAALPHHRLDGYYHSIILPAKLRLDREYMAQATFLTDLKLIVDTIVRRWDSSEICKLLELQSAEMQSKAPKPKVPVPLAIKSSIVGITSDETLASAD
jgi:lipopolysaccharide/colanic/teichoic acid biosynthesis glycosyltransferase